MSRSSSNVRNFIPLPPTPADWVRKVKFNYTINDQVEEIHKAVLDRPEYVALLQAVYDEQAVEGSLAADNTLAAMELRKHAAKSNSPIAKEKLATISKALNVVMRRYGVSRKERRNMVSGEIVPGDSGD